MFPPTVFSYNQERITYASEGVIFGGCEYLFHLRRSTWNMYYSFYCSVLPWTLLSLSTLSSWLHTSINFKKTKNASLRPFSVCRNYEEHHVHDMPIALSDKLAKMQLRLNPGANHSQVQNIPILLWNPSRYRITHTIFLPWDRTA